MNKLLLIFGILLHIAAGLSLVWAGLSWMAYMNAMDGTAGMYIRLHHSAVLSLCIGIGLLLLGIGCLVVRKFLR